MDHDIGFMNRALELAAQPAFTSPNPRVGAVVVRDGAIIGEGTHQGAGTPHAERLALQGVDARGATIYVNLEPCSHVGRTPPCAPALIEAGIAKVVVAIQDPDPRVAGQGFDLLRSQGVEVVVGVLADEAERLNRSYLHHRQTRRPFVTLKLALSLDGKLAAGDGSSRWITSEASRRRVHARRLQADAVLVGAGTVLADDPSLTVRDVEAKRQPVRVVCDATGKTQAAARLFSSGETLMVTTISCPHAVKTAWKEAGAEVITVPQDRTGRVALDQMIETLGTRGWLEVYCEGGAEIATSLLREDLVDRLEIDRGPLLIGDQGLGVGDLGISTMNEASRWTLVEHEANGDDVTTIYERRR